MIMIRGFSKKQLNLMIKKHEKQEKMKCKKMKCKKEVVVLFLFKSCIKCNL